jgi:S-adenosylmethionine-diacylglycerol 3-amino-3-carboxypropyl transferase
MQLRNPIRFAQSWEDHRVIERGLAVKKGDAVVSILSSGDNVLNLLRFEPKILYGFDINPAQVCEVQLKIAAIKHLTHPDFLTLLGYAGTDEERIRVFHSIAPYLDSQTKDFWDHHLKMLECGLSFQGAFERYLSRLGCLARFFLAEDYPRYVRAQTRDERQRIFDEKINRPFLRRLTRMVMQNQAVNHVFFQNNALQFIPRSFDYNECFWNNLSHACVDIGCTKNPYLYWLFTGAMPEDRRDWQPYLQEEQFALLRQETTKIRLFQQDICTGLKKMDADSIDAFYLSDIFGWMSSVEIEKTLGEVVRVAKPHAKIICFVLNYDMGVPQSMHQYLEHDEHMSRELHDQERAGFYSKINLYTVTK